MLTLVYKRTHSGDPDDAGRFGVYDCMGRVRSWDYEAVTLESPVVSNVE